MERAMPATASSLIISVPLDQCTLDSRLQMRAALHFDVIEEYAGVIDSLPPCKAIRIGEHYWITDGWHSYHAHKKANRDEIMVSYREGTFVDALVEAAGANHTHGMRRTNDDKRRAVRALLSEQSWASKSDRLIADTCHVSNHLVSSVREEIGAAPDETTDRYFPDSTGNSPSRNGRLFQPPDDEPPEEDEPPAKAKRTGKDGRARPSTNPKPAKDAPPSEDDPPDEPEEMVDEAGYSIPAKLRKLFAQREDIRSAQAILARAATKMFETEMLDAYKVGEKASSDRKQYSTVLTTGAKKLRDIEFHTVHQKCGGNGCSQCGNKGYYTREEAGDNK